MKFRQAYRHFLQLIWAFAVLWLSLGSLINFHQHHIWRRQLIPQVVASVNKKDKVKPAYQSKQPQDNSNDNGIDQYAAPEQFSDASLLFGPLLTLLTGQDDTEIILSGTNRSPHLRAPPAA